MKYKQGMHPNSIVVRFKKGQASYNKNKTGEKSHWFGRKHSKKTKEKMSESRKKYLEKHPEQKMNVAKNHWKKLGFDFFGEKNPSWKGGVTPKNELIRHSDKYEQWRKAVFERDNFTCQICGQRGGWLEADHIKSFAKYPELRFDVNNGRTLCYNCHTETETWGNRK